MIYNENERAAIQELFENGETLVMRDKVTRGAWEIVDTCTWEWNKYDYKVVVTVNDPSEIPTEISILYIYLCNGEYYFLNNGHVINSSGLTNNQMNAINSGIDASTIKLLTDAIHGKQAKLTFHEPIMHDLGENITLDTTGVWSGTASTAIYDDENNKISETFFKKAGGEISGPVTIGTTASKANLTVNGQIITDECINLNGIQLYYEAD